MVLVKDGSPPDPDAHVAVLLGDALSQVRQLLLTQDWQGLRQSHFRLLSMVPKDGISITDLATGLGMTKQGCGQFVAFLTGMGHLSVDPDAEDGRVKVVRRTGSGDDIVQLVGEQIAELERQWATRVGVRRYATFRRVLAELAAPVS